MSEKYEWMKNKHTQLRQLMLSGQYKRTMVRQTQNFICELHGEIEKLERKNKERKNECKNLMKEISSFIDFAEMTKQNDRVREMYFSYIGRDCEAEDDPAFHTVLAEVVSFFDKQIAIMSEHGMYCLFLNMTVYLFREGGFRKFIHIGKDLEHVWFNLRDNEGAWLEYIKFEKECPEPA